MSRAKFTQWTNEVPSVQIVNRYEGLWSWRGPVRLDGQKSDNIKLRVFDSEVMCVADGDCVPINEWGGEWKKSSVSRSTTRRMTAEMRDRAIAWLRGNDTGTSSETIWSVMTGWPVKSDRTPSDPSDFGRCERLLRLFPQWRKRLPEVAKVHPRWAPLVREWPRLVALYDRDYPTGESLDLWEAMEGLNMEGGSIEEGPNLVTRMKQARAKRAAEKEAQRKAAQQVVRRKR